MNVCRAEWIASVGVGGTYPPAGLCEIAMVGRSNVGKSSLINAVCNYNKLARVSQQPGKTRLVNYFRVNESFYLVDLPGYGYASAAKGEIQRWSDLVEGYFSTGRVTHVFLLLDIRHDPTQQDHQMFDYIRYYAMPHTIITTKADKLARSKCSAAAARTTRLLGAITQPVCVSVSEKKGLDAVRGAIGRIVSDYGNIALRINEGD